MAGFGIIVLSILVGSILGALLGMKLMRKHFVKGRAGTMRRGTARGSFLDPRTKILIWLLANVVVFTWTPAVFRIAVMLVYFSLFLLERKGKMLVGLLLGLSGHRGSAVLAVAAAAWISCHGLCHSDLFYSGLSLHCRRGLHHCHYQCQPVHGRSGTVGSTPELFHHSGGDPPVLPALRQGLPAYPGRYGSARDPRPGGKKLECIYVPMLMGAAQTAEELSESATARGIEHPGRMSSLRPIGFHVQDAAMTLLFLALCVGGICCKGVLP